MRSADDDEKQLDNSHLETATLDSEPGNATAADSADPAEEAAVIRKLDRVLLPFVFILYSLAILDRSNLGNAKLAHLPNDIDLSGNRYGLLGTIFYVAYIISQPAIAGWKYFRPHYWATFCVFSWGFVATIQATAHSWSGLMACRFFLGVAEACFGPGVPLYLSFFYPRDKVGFRQGVFIAGAAAANVYGSVLAYGITQIRGSLAPWRILFIIEGLPTCALALFTFFFLPDSIAHARFLSARDKAVARRMVSRDQILDEGAAKHGLNWKEYLAAFKVPQAYLPPIMYFSVNVSFASLPLFVPTIISELGAFSQVQAQGLSAPPYALVLLTILACSWLSDRVSMRGPFIFGSGLVAALGFILLATLTSPVGRYIGVFLAVQCFISVSLLLCWVCNLNSTESKRAAGTALMATVGQCGPLVGTNIFPPSEGPYYRKGMWISAAFCLLLAFTAAALSFWLAAENRKMEKAGVLDAGYTDEGADKDNAGERLERKFKHIW